MDQLENDIVEGTAILLTPRQGQKVVFKVHRRLTAQQAHEIKELIQAKWSTDVPFVVVDETVDVYVASDAELRSLADGPVVAELAHAPSDDRDGTRSSEPTGT